MNWEWLGSDDHADKSGTAKFVFADTEISFKLPSFLIAHNLAQAIEREIQRARQQGRKELSDEIYKALEPRKQ